MAFSQKSVSTKTTKGNRPSYLGENTLIYTSSTNRPNTTLANPMYLAKFHYKGTQYGLTKARSNSLLGQGSPKALSVTQKAASSPVHVKPKVKRSETSIISDLPSCQEANESKSQIIEEEDMLKLKLKTHSDGNIDPSYEWIDEKKSIDLQENTCLIQNIMTEKYSPKSPLPQKPNLTKPINKKPNDTKKENSLNLVMAKSISYGIEERDTTPKLKAKPTAVPAPTKSSQKITPKANPVLVIDCNLNAASKTKREEDKKKAADENSSCLASTPTLHTQERESFGPNDLQKINKVPTSMMSVHKVSQSVQIPKGIDLKENKDILKQISENDTATRSSQTLAPKVIKEIIDNENKSSTFKSSPTLAPKGVQITKENKEISESVEKLPTSATNTIKSSQTLTPKIPKEKENKETSKQASENQDSNKLLISTKSAETLAPKTTVTLRDSVQDLIPKTSPTTKERFHNRPNTTLLETSLDHSLMATVIVKDSKPRSTKVSSSATLQRDQYSSKLVASKVPTNANKLSSPNRASSSRIPLSQTRSSLNMNFNGNNELQPSKHSEFSFKMQYFQPIDDSKLTEYIRDINESQCFKRKDDKNQSISYNVDKSFNLNKNLETNPSTQTILSTKNMNKENQENTTTTVNPEHNPSKFKKNPQSSQTTVKKDQPIKKKEYITFSAHHSTQEDDWISHKSKENIDHKIEANNQKDGRVSDVSLLPKKLLMPAHKPKVKDLNIKIESKASTTYSKLDKLLQELKSNPSIDATRIPRGGMEPDEQEGGLFSGSGIASSSSSTNCSVNKSYINTLRKVTGSQS